jgi:hypothetical protein
MGAEGLVEAIAFTIKESKRLPLYVAEGSSVRKLERIYANPYLRHCLSKLSSMTGPVFVYGLSAGDKDAHIYETVFRAPISHLYYCIHRPTAQIEEVAGELARYKERTGSAVEYSFVDSETVHVWG